MKRYLSLDVFRGATVAFMILVNNPGSWAHLFPPLSHATWHGCTPADLVFPFFLFAVGNAMAFVLPKMEKEADVIFWKKISTRFLLIFLIGLMLNWFPFFKYNDEGNLVPKLLSRLRIFGVLQRIALCYFLAAIIIRYFKTSGAFVTAVFLMLVYWFICVSGNPADPYSLNGWFGTALDIKILGADHLYKGEGVPFDPEGLMSTLAAVSSVLFGYLVGNYIMLKNKIEEQLNGLLIAGVLLLFSGYVWGMVFPINKKIWTSSYTVYSTGIALMVLSLIIYVIELKNVTGWWSAFFEKFGKNALFVFVLSGALPRLLALIRIHHGIDASDKEKFISPLGWYYENICAQVGAFDPRIGSLFYAITLLLFFYFIAWLLDRKRIYIRV